jgi:hypothetical protein
VISCGANVPLLIKKSFGPIMEDVDTKCLIPYYIQLYGVYLFTSLKCLLRGPQRH